MNQMRFVCVALVMLIGIPSIMGSSCQLRAAMSQVRDVHSGVVAGFSTTDTIVSELFETAGDECIAAAHAAGLEGEAGRDHARECMEVWYSLETALSASREVLGELELIYDDIENGEDRYSEWTSAASRLLVHGRQIAEVMVSLGVDVPDELTRALDALSDLG